MKQHIVIFILFALFWACSDAKKAPTADAIAGQKIYETYCLTCHQADGSGVPKMNPPLIKTDWVLGDKTRLIKVVLNGLKNPIEINGDTYNGAMASHDFLKDEEIADVLSYVRSHFGNAAEAVSAAEVKTVRDQK
jgi:mono/diheme cytochrome c family protein